jgi:hypothetical protein
MPDLDLIRTIRNGVTRWARWFAEGGGQPWRPERLFPAGPGVFQLRSKFCCRFAVFAAAREEGLTLG